MVAGTDEGASGQVDRAEFERWWRAQQGQGQGGGGGRLELGELARLARMREVGGQLGDALMAMLAQHYRCAPAAGSGANRKAFKTDRWCAP